jgi:hypothetical protein
MPLALDQILEEMMHEANEVPFPLFELSLEFDLTFFSPFFT